MSDGFMVLPLSAGDIEAAQSGHGEYYVEVVREDPGEVTIIITLITNID